VMPALLGTAADEVGLRRAMLIVPVLCCARPGIGRDGEPVVPQSRAMIWSGGPFSGASLKESSCSRHPAEAHITASTVSSPGTFSRNSSSETARSPASMARIPPLSRTISA
jgi:hypothetical protein